MRKLNLVDEDIVNSYLAGNSGYKVAKLFNTSQTQVRRILERNGVNGRSLRTPEEVENKIIEAYLGGESSEKIAAWCNLRPTTVCRIIKRNVEAPSPNVVWRGILDRNLFLRKLLPSF